MKKALNSKKRRKGWKTGDLNLSILMRWNTIWLMLKSYLAYLAIPNQRFDSFHHENQNDGIAALKSSRLRFGGGCFTVAYNGNFRNCSVKVAHWGRSL
ncbi:MAG: hypothetical protein LBT13_01655 [Treponema sp.]|jgi:hypothetical protein|nr:hypothetical protein [Treponema sp.]